MGPIRYDIRGIASAILRGMKTTKLEGAVKGTVRGEMVKAVATIADPAAWLIEVRRICEALKLDPARAIILGEPLLVVCAGVIDEAAKQGRTVEEARAAIG